MFDWLSDLQPALDAQTSWYNGQYNEDSLHHLTCQAEGPFVIACGAGLLADHIRRFRFTQPLIQRMGQFRDEQGRGLFSESFLNHLQRLRLRVYIDAAPEGMLLLPGEPLAIVRGPLLQVQLMESVLRLQIWRSSQWATRIALQRWNEKAWAEEDTPVAPTTTSDFDGWKIRAEYIGGAMADQIIDTLYTRSRPINTDEGLICVWRSGAGSIGDEIPLTQIRRLYRSQEAVGDLWLTEPQEASASVSKTSARMLDTQSGKVLDMRFTRFQNIYQPLLVKGHPVVASTRISYLRQRMLKQLEAFHNAPLVEYPRGWFV